MLLHFADQFSGVSFGFSGDDYDVFCMENYALHKICTILVFVIGYLWLIHGVSIEMLWDIFLQIYGFRVLFCNVKMAQITKNIMKRKCLLFRWLFLP